MCIDGMYVEVMVPQDNKPIYRNRIFEVIVNVLSVCNTLQEKGIVNNTPCILSKCNNKKQPHIVDGNVVTWYFWQYTCNCYLFYCFVNLINPVWIYYLCHENIILKYLLLSIIWWLDYNFDRKKYEWHKILYLKYSGNKILHLISLAFNEKIIMNLKRFCLLLDKYILSRFILKLLVK